MSPVFFSDCNRVNWRISGCPLNFCLDVRPFSCYAELKETGLVVTVFSLWFSLVLLEFKTVGIATILEMCSLFLLLKEKNPNPSSAT